MDGIPDWGNVITTAMLAFLPPVIVEVVMQRLFTKGLLETGE